MSMHFRILHNGLIPGGVRWPRKASEATLRLGALRRILRGTVHRDTAFVNLASLLRPLGRWSACAYRILALRRSAFAVAPCFAGGLAVLPPIVERRASAHASTLVPHA